MHPLNSKTAYHMIAMRFYICTTNVPNFMIYSLVSLSILSYSCSYLTLCVAAEGQNGTRFSYDEATGRGPSRWGQLDPNWYLCGSGTRQSPIDISTMQLEPVLGNLQTDYKAAPATLYNKGNKIEVNWNGSDAGKLTINGTEYKLLELHWHTPAEHRINGISLALEIHLVHKSPRGDIAVVAILYKYGQPDPFLSKLYPLIRSLGNETREIPLGIVNPRDIEYKSSTSRKFYRYNGSLTTPPCSEGVVWSVLGKVQTVSWEQVQALKEAVDYEYNENARPSQPLNGRQVHLYFSSF